ncbi:MAG: CoA-binding protein [Spirochaetaceae bacterium]|nr:CoA-binding protein [Spirochaetaceae bacterium]
MLEQWAKRPFAVGMELDLVSYLKEGPRMALVGATNNSTKFGNIIFRDMVSKGYQVIPVNPRATTVNDVQAYPDLSAATRDHDIGLVVYVVPPKHTLESLKEARQLGLQKVWVQPGAGNQDVRSYLDENGFEYLMDACVMVETR